MGLDASSSGDTSFPYSQLTPPLFLFRSVLALSTRCSATVPAADWGEGHRGRRKGNRVWGAPRSTVTGLAPRCRPPQP